MKVRFIGNQNDPADQRPALEAWGKVFAIGEDIDVSDLSEYIRVRIARNGHFEVVDAPKKRGRPRKSVRQDHEAETVDD